MKFRYGLVCRCRIGSPCGGQSCVGERHGLSGLPNPRFVRLTAICAPRGRTRSFIDVPSHVTPGSSASPYVCLIRIGRKSTLMSRSNRGGAYGRNLADNLVAYLRKFITATQTTTEGHDKSSHELQGIANCATNRFLTRSAARSYKKRLFHLLLMIKIMEQPTRRKRSTEGVNPYGRGGTMKCKACRVAKKRVCSSARTH